MGNFTTRPLIQGKKGVIAAGHYLATAAGFRMLAEGGNAVDAGVAAGLALSVLEPHLNGLGGEVPILVYPASQGRPVAINGQGTAPQACNIEFFRSQGIAVIPWDGFLPATVPSAFSSWLTLLARFGTFSLAQVAEPAIELAAQGFPVYYSLQKAIQDWARRFTQEWPTSAQVFLPGGRVPEVGQILVRMELARTLEKTVAAEQKALSQGKSRYEALQAARDAFYRGEIADALIKFCSENEILDATGKKHRGLLSLEDLAQYQDKVEDPVTVNYRGYDVYKCGPWSQGPVFLQQLNLLEGYELAPMGHNSAEYIHLLIEVAKLAFADREKYYGDPDFVSVPLEKLLAKGYAAQRRKLLNPGRASLELVPGDAALCSKTAPEAADKTGDTTHLDVIDAQGNMVSATPSGGWFSASPVVPGVGFPLGTRGQTFYLDPNHANAPAPGKRPRTTLSPSLVLKEGKPFMVFGTPGGDQQDQWSLQVFLNFVDFALDLQEAIDAPNFYTAHFPSSFYPHRAAPGQIQVEARIAEEVVQSLRDKGHEVRVGDAWGEGRVLAVKRDPGSGVIQGAASPRMETGYALGW